MLKRVLTSQVGGGGELPPPPPPLPPPPPPPPPLLVAVKVKSTGERKELGVVVALTVEVPGVPGAFQKTWAEPEESDVMVKVDCQGPV